MKTSTKPAETCTNFRQPEVNNNGSVKDSAIFIQTDQQESCVNAVPATSQTEFLVECISKCQVELCSECGGKKNSASPTSTSTNKQPTQDVCEMGAQTDWCSTLVRLAAYL